MQELAAAKSLEAADRGSLRDSALESYARPLDADESPTRLSDELLGYVCCMLEFDRVQTTSSSSSDTKDVSDAVDFLLAKGYW